MRSVVRSPNLAGGTARDTFAAHAADLLHTVKLPRSVKATPLASLRCASCWDT